MTKKKKPPVQTYLHKGLFRSDAHIVYHHIHKSQMQRKIFYLLAFSVMFIGGEMLSKQIPETDEQKQATSVLKTENHTNTTRQEATLSPVVRVIDGDTIVVEINGAQERIRLIGVNTPETVDSRKQVECFGKEASAFVKNLLSGKSVRLESDTTQGDRDKYGRLLHYVFLEDGTLLNKTIIIEGYGHEYTYRTPYRYQAEFKTAERTAREEKRGLWGDVCGGN